MGAFSSPNDTYQRNVDEQNDLDDGKYHATKMSAEEVRHIDNMWKDEKFSESE